MKKRTKTSHKDNRHTTKPYTNNMWDTYEYKYFRFTTEELSRQYNVSKTTIYHWNTEMKKRWKEKNKAWMKSLQTVEDLTK